MKPKTLIPLLKTAVTHNRTVLIKGKPGIGKSDIVHQVQTELGCDLVLFHPAISDPTDYSGFPNKTSDEQGSYAEFLPFGGLRKLIRASKKTIAFIDDIGQASPAVQAALMQLVLARRVNGHSISDHVSFICATNDTSHMAGVSGMIEPLKSRSTIIELEVSLDDWTDWALNNGMPSELVAFVRFRPNLLCDFKPTKSISNSPSPRTWFAVGKWLDAGVKDLEVFTGCVGEGAATEFWSFLDLYTTLPSLDAILLNPDTEAVPDKASGRFAVTCGLARKMNPANFDRAITYLKRLPKEFEVCAVKDAVRLDKSLHHCKSLITWLTKNQNVLV